MTAQPQSTQAPEFVVSEWMNAEAPPSLAQLRGRVVVIEAFQMLCPGCVSHGLPLAKAIRETFPEEQVAVLGLHSVFEHHAAMTPVSLKAFLHEYRIDFPVAVDAHDAAGVPQTMRAYGMRGTPTLIVIDREGVQRLHVFGHVSEMRIGAVIAGLLAERGAPLGAPAAVEDATECTDEGCPV